MSLRDKYTKEEWIELEKMVFKGGMCKDIPDNKIDPKEYTMAENYNLIDDIMENAAQAIKDRCDNVDGLVFSNIKDKKSTEPSLFLLDEIGQMKTPSYNSPPITLNHDDEVGPFGKTPKEVSWDFIPLKPGIKFDYPDLNKDVANSIDFLKTKMNSEMKQSSIINQMTNKILEKKANGIIPEVAIMSMGDYDEFHKTIPYTHSHENNSNIITSGVRIAGVTLLIYPSPNIEDGNIKIY